jgi:hypothetical protein
MLTRLIFSSNRSRSSKFLLSTNLVFSDLSFFFLRRRRFSFLSFSRPLPTFDFLLFYLINGLNKVPILLSVISVWIRKLPASFGIIALLVSTACAAGDPDVPWYA